MNATANTPIQYGKTLDIFSLLFRIFQISHLRRPLLAKLHSAKMKFNFFGKKAILLATHNPQ